MWSRPAEHAGGTEGAVVVSGLYRASGIGDTNEAGVGVGMSEMVGAVADQHDRITGWSKDGLPPWDAGPITFGDGYTTEIRCPTNCGATCALHNSSERVVCLPEDDRPTGADLYETARGVVAVVESRVAGATPVCVVHHRGDHDAGRCGALDRTGCVVGVQGKTFDDQPAAAGVRVSSIAPAALAVQFVSSPGCPTRSAIRASCSAGLGVGPVATPAIPRRSMDTWPVTSWS